MYAIKSNPSKYKIILPACAGSSHLLVLACTTSHNVRTFYLRSVKLIRGCQGIAASFSAMQKSVLWSPYHANRLSITELKTRGRRRCVFSVSCFFPIEIEEITKS